MNLQKLRGYIKGAGYTEYSLADAISMARSTLSFKLNGKVSFTVEEARLIGDVLHISLEELAAIFFA